MRARWHKLGAACAGALLALAMAASAQQSPDWKRCVNEDNEFSTDVQISRCTAIIQSGRENRKNRAIAFNNRGLAYYKTDDNDHAIADFNKAVGLDPQYDRAYSARASAWSDKGDHDRAISNYNLAIRLNTKNPIALNNRCDELLIVRQPHASLADCNESLRLRPGHANTLMHRGNAHLVLGQLDRAIADYDAALGSKPNDAWSLYGRGLTKIRQRDAAAGAVDTAAAKAIDANIAGTFERYGLK